MPKGLRKIEINNILLNKRKLFLFDEVNNETVYELIKKMYALTYIAKTPIHLYLNSGGGGISDGLALIDVMRTIEAPVYTYIVGEVCSMGGIISICGAKRFITANSIWMGHPGSGGASGGKFMDQRARMKSIDFVEEKVDDLFRKHTKLTEDEIIKMKVTESWYDCNECLEKGIVDSIL